MWHPNSDEWRVGPIVDELRAIATAHNVGFYVNAKEEEEEEPVVVSKDVSISDDTLGQLRGLATKAGVTIYVNPCAASTTFAGRVASGENATSERARRSRRSAG